MTAISRNNHILRRVAVLISGLAAGWWLLALILHLVVGDEPVDRSPEGILVGVFMLTAPLAALAGWRLRKWGWLVLFIYGLLFSAFGYWSSGHNHWLAVSVTGLPFMVSGLLVRLALETN